MAARRRAGRRESPAAAEPRLVALAELQGRRRRERSGRPSRTRRRPRVARTAGPPPRTVAPRSRSPRRAAGSRPGTSGPFVPLVGLRSPARRARRPRGRGSTTPAPRPPCCDGGRAVRPRRRGRSRSFRRFVGQLSGRAPVPPSKDADGNYIATCQSRRPAENGLPLDAVGNPILITVLTPILSRGCGAPASIPIANTSAWVRRMSDGTSRQSVLLSPEWTTSSTARS